MAIFLEVFQRIEGFNYKSVAILDGWNSLIIYENYYSCNTYELTIALTKENIFNFKTENVFNFDHCYYYVDELSTTETTLVVRGKSLGGKYDSRIIDRTYIANKSPALIAYDHFNQEMINPSNYTDAKGSYSGANRKIDYLSLAPTDGLGLASIDYQSSYQEVGAQVETLCQTYDFGFREVAQSDLNPSNQIQIYKGRDLSGVIQISDDFDNLINVTYENNTYDLKTSGYVFGEGDGANRVKVVLNPELIGLERKELYVDARDVQSTNVDTGVTIPAATYRNMLTDRGNQKLSERVSVLTLNGEIQLNSKLFKFKKDFDVGDRVKLSSDLYQMAKISTIVQAKRTYDEKGEFVELIFDKDTPTIFDIIKRN